MDGLSLGGRALSPELQERIRIEVTNRPTLSRSQLAREVCEWLDWKGPDGKPKETSCRIALRNLERRGALELPEAKGQIPPATRRVASDEPAASPLQCSIAELGELTGVVVTSAERELNDKWNGLMAHHYLGPGPLVGAQIRYLIGCDQGWVAALAFSAAAWSVAARDEWIGWSPEARKANLQFVVSNSRFLIPAWVKVPNLASKVLALCSGELPQDWKEIYGYEPVLLETYVEQERFAGTCYRAANWQHVGQTSGLGRQARGRERTQSIKDIYLLSLAEDWKSTLCREPNPRPTPSRLKHEPRDWAEEEFGGASLGDDRRTQRLLALGRCFYGRSQASIPQACGTLANTKAAYRWLSSKHVNLKDILAPHQEATTRRIAEHPVVLSVQDTTSFNYSSHPALEGTGPIGSREDGPKGILMHDTMAYTTQGLPLGLVDVQVWARDPADFGKKHRRAALPIEMKESSKWLQSFKATAAVQAQCPDTTVVSVGDREADIYELFVLALSSQDNPELLVRAEQDRLVADGQEHLWPHLKQQPVCATQLVQVTRTKTAKERIAHLEIRFAPIELQPPRGKKRLKPVKLWAVLAVEIDAPPEVQPLEWMLLTTIAVANPEQSLEKLEWYTKRWGIETFHKTVKSGCKIEERQLATVPRIENCLAIDLVVAWRILHLTMLGRETPELPCTVFFEEHEWKALYAFTARDLRAVPVQPPTIREAMRTVAGLGGFLGRKSDGEPGVKTLWIGLQILDTVVFAWLTFGPESPRAP